MRHRVPLQRLPPRQLPAPRRRQPGLLPQIRRRPRPLRRCHLHPHAPRRRCQPPGLPPRHLQRRLQPHAPHEGPLARNLHPRRRPRLLRYPLCHVLLRRRPGQVSVCRGAFNLMFFFCF